MYDSVKNYLLMFPFCMCSLSLWLLLVFEMCTWLILMNQMLVASFSPFFLTQMPLRLEVIHVVKAQSRGFMGMLMVPKGEWKRKNQLYKWLLSFYLPNITSDAQWISLPHCILSCMHYKAACTCPVIAFTFSLRFLINSIWHLIYHYVCRLSSKI